LFIDRTVEATRLFPFWLDPHDPHFTQTFFMAYRSLHLDSGVSPVLPLLALLGAYFGWGRVHLKRVTMRFERLASLPVLGSGPEIEVLTDRQRSMERVLNEPLPMHWRTLGSFALAAGIFVYIGHALNSFEPAAFDLLVLLLLAVCTRYFFTRGLDCNLPSMTSRADLGT
jgi:hypothetical protein